MKQFIAAEKMACDLIKSLKLTIKHGNKTIMIQRCFQKKEIENILMFEGKMDSLKYITILNNNLFKSALDLNLENILF